jgi:TPR repeat protein
MKNSRLVAIRTGRSSGLRWEFRKCLELLRPEQLLLVVGSEAELNEMLADMGTLYPTTPSFQLGWRSIASIRAFVIFRESWKPFLLRVKSSRFWYTKQVDSSYIQPRLAYTLRPLFEQLGVPWPKPAISGRNLGTSLSLIGLLVWCVYLIVYPGAADKENARATFDTGLRYEYGRGSWPQDYAKAREKYEEAAAKGNGSAMNHLGALYATGHSVAQDYAKARGWWEKAADKGDENAKAQLKRLPISAAAAAGRYAEALHLQEGSAAEVEAEETKREGKPGEETAGVLGEVAWYALFAREFTKALTASDRAHALLPDDLEIEANRAHALMFVGHGHESEALYLAHKGKPISLQDRRLWERVIAEDFVEFRKSGLTHPMMADIERKLGVSR